MLSKEVEQMKAFLKANEGKGVPESPTTMEESLTYASAKQALGSSSNTEVK